STRRVGSGRTSDRGLFANAVTSRQVVESSSRRGDSSRRLEDSKTRRLQFLVIALLLLAACSGGAKKTAAPPRPAEPEIDFTLIDSPSLQFLPRHEEAQGWRLEEDPMVIPAERIGTYLGPDGAHFLRYEVIDVTAGKYEALDGRGFATVEIFRFPDFVKA